MSKVTLDLAWATPRPWADYILDNFDEFLIDHANAERKASALALSFAVKYADRREMIPALIELAREELVHFQQVYALMEARGLRLAPDSKDPYVNALNALCRSQPIPRFLDRMLVSSLVETRGAERFRLIHEALRDEELKRFYRELCACEAKHGNLFTELALLYFPEQELYARLQEFLRAEAEIAQRLEWRPSLH